jgi:hypothetical protein
MDETGRVLVVRVRSPTIDSRVFRRDQGGLATVIAVWTEDDLPGSNSSVVAHHVLFQETMVTSSLL